jgi:hypothetical protein
MAKKTEKAPAANFIVRRSMLGPYREGRIVSRDELKSMGANIDDLVKIKAIESTEDAATKGAVPPGPHADLMRDKLDKAAEERESSGEGEGDEGVEAGEGEEVDEDAIPSKNELARMNREELMAVADKHGIEYAEGVKKSDLIDLLSAQEPADEGNG